MDVLHTCSKINQVNLYSADRELLRHVLGEKLAVFQERSEGRQQLEECLKALLVKDIKPLWPKGWMPSRYEMGGAALLDSSVEST